jgi:hypothetical protein
MNSHQALSGVRALECRLGRARVALPFDVVDRFIEFEAVPLPLARRWVRGVAFNDGRLVVVIGLLHEAPSAAGKGIVLRVDGRRDIAWVVEISEILSFVRLSRRLPAPSSSTTTTKPLPRWLGAVMTEDGRTIGWLDADLLAEELRAGEGLGALE